jgi:hypothetical protein
MRQIMVELMSACERCWQTQRYSLEILIRRGDSYGLLKEFVCADMRAAVCKIRVDPP